MKKNTILKKLETREEKLIEAIDDIRDFLDSVEDEELSSMTHDFVDGLLDFIHENDICSLTDIKDFVENDYEQN